MANKKFKDPHGKIQCDDCDCMVAPKGGVTTELTGSRVHLMYNLPAGWAVDSDGAVLCGMCSKPEPVSN